MSDTHYDHITTTTLVLNTARIDRQTNRQKLDRKARYKSSSSDQIFIFILNSVRKQKRNKSGSNENHLRNIDIFHDFFTIKTIDLSSKSM